MKKFATLRPKGNTQLTTDSNKNKESKGTKTCVTNRKLKLEDYNNFLEATNLENKVNQPGKNLNIESFIKSHKEFIKKQ